MKNNIIILFREFFISVDFIILLITVIFSFIVKVDIEKLNLLYTYISSNNDTLSLKIIIGIHVLAFIWLVNIYNKILLPDKSFNKILIGFNEYQSLKITAIVAIIEPCISIVLLLSMVIFDLNLLTSNKSILVIGLFIYTGISVTTSFFAELKIKELLFKHDPYEKE